MLYKTFRPAPRFFCFAALSVMMIHMKQRLPLFLTTFLICASPAKATCWDEASAQHGIPSDVLKAIAKVESNFNASAIRRPFKAGNKDGSYDVGLVQINSSHFPMLKSRFGISEQDLYDPCTNLKVGAWILSDNVRRLGWNWNAIGAYNAGCRKLSAERCNELRSVYANKVYAALQGVRALPHSGQASPVRVAAAAGVRPNEGTRTNRPIDSLAKRESVYVAISIDSTRDGVSGYYGDRL